MKYNRKTSIAFGIGILSGLQILVFFYLHISIYFILLSLFIFFFVSYRLQWNRYAYLLFVGGVFLGMTRIMTWDPYPPSFLQDIYEKNIQAEGTIVSFPERKGNIMQYDIHLKSINEFSVDMAVRVTAAQHTKLVRGEKIIVEGKLEQPFESNEFSYKEYLSRNNIYGVMKYPHMEHISSPSFFWKYLGNIRYMMQSHISSTYNYPYGGFLEGLLLGRKYGLSDELSDIFQTTGLTHIIAISGYNITLIILIFSNLFSFLGRYGKVFACSLAVILFTLLVGAQAAVVRACLMGIVGLLGLLYGRQVFVWGALLWAIVIMTYIEPRTFLFDVGFQLSVAATIGVIALSEKTIRWFSFLPDILEIRNSFAITIAAQITTLPLLIYYFHSVSLVSPLANVLVAPFLPWAMLFGFIQILLSFIPILSESIYFLTEGILRITVFLAKQVSIIPYANIQVPFIQNIFVIFSYISIFFWLSKKKADICLKTE